MPKLKIQPDYDLAIVIEGMTLDLYFAETPTEGVFRALQDLVESNNGITIDPTPRDPCGELITGDPKKFYPYLFYRLKISPIYKIHEVVPLIGVYFTNEHRLKVAVLDACKKELVSKEVLEIFTQVARDAQKLSSDSYAVNL